MVVLCRDHITEEERIPPFFFPKQVRLRGTYPKPQEQMRPNEPRRLDVWQNNNKTILTTYYDIKRLKSSSPTVLIYTPDFSPRLSLNTDYSLVSWRRAESFQDPGKGNRVRGGLSATRVTFQSLRLEDTTTLSATGGWASPKWHGLPAMKRSDAGTERKLARSFLLQKCWLVCTSVRCMLAA